MTKAKALVVLSGGQDSTTALFMAKNGGYELHAVSFDYGQRHRREIAAAAHIAILAGCKTHEVIHLKDLMRSTSPLVDHNAPLEQYSSAEQMAKVIGDRVELTFVPMRNALFLTIAANRAVALGCGTIWTGVCADDNANYPDCTEDFIFAMDQMVHQALGITDKTPSVYAPLLNIPKPQAILQALNIPGCYTALAYSHTAYDGSYPPRGADHATVLRADSFLKADVPDPLIVRAVLEGELHTFPATANYASALEQLIDAKHHAERHGPQFAIESLEADLRHRLHRRIAR